MRHRPGWTVALLLALASAGACDRSTAPAGASGPRLLEPADGVRFRQNDATIGCPAHPTAGHGHRVAFAWQAVPGATAYRLVYQRTGSAVPLVHETLEGLRYERTDCGSYVADVNLSGWLWRVGAIMPRPGAAPDTLWSEARRNGFAACRLADGRPCHSTE